MIQTLHTDPDGDMQMTAEHISDLPSSIDEMQLFYREVMGCDAPPGRGRNDHELLDLFE